MGETAPTGKISGAQSLETPVHAQLTSAVYSTNIPSQVGISAEKRLASTHILAQNCVL